MYGHKRWLCWKISVQCGRELNFLHSDITVIILHGQILILYNWRPYLSITPRTIVHIIIVGQDVLSNGHRQSGTRGLRPLLAQAALALCLPVTWEQNWQCFSPFMFVFGDSSQADVRLLDPGTGGGLGSWRVLTEVSSSMTSLMTSWHMGERLTSCGLGSEQRRLKRRILFKQINGDDIAS